VVLPALMLGIPVQVAGCHEVVFATPPRRDGALSPEAVYVAHLIGASVILKAGGAQAIATLAYGTDALVSIDMPAGPSEVLVCCF